MLDGKPELERKLARYREVLLEYPDGPIAETIRELIAEIEQQLRDFEK